MNITIEEYTKLPLDNRGSMEIIGNSYPDITIPETDVMKQYCDFLQNQIFDQIIILFLTFLFIESLYLINRFFIKNEKITSLVGSFRNAHYIGCIFVFTSLSIRLIVYNTYISMVILNYILIVIIGIVILVLYFTGKYKDIIRFIQKLKK